MNPVETILLKNIDKPSAFFVFPTDIAVSRWIDRLLTLRGHGTVAMEKFIAWDRFKQNSIKSRVQNRQSVPSVLRKMFVSMLIRENAELCAENGEPVFSDLIQVKWAAQADSFADWLAGILPHLALWFSRTTGLPIAEIQDDSAARKAEGLSGEDRDLFTLALRYTRFLAEHELFEPAWETPPFDDTGKECFIFFSESLLDFEEYRELLEASDHVEIVRTYTTTESTQDSRNHDVFFYTNSRSEITEAALYILALHGDRNIPWDSISVSVPDTEAYGPYLFREFENRNIPYIRQTGKPLASYPAGQFFRAITDCASSDFSFSSMTALLLNRRLPWKDDREIRELIDFGIRNNCITSWTEEGPVKVNVWEDAFSHPFGGLRPQTRFFFENLKRRANDMRRAKSFAEIRKNYFIFRERFFDMENCLDETDLVLSRCISELVYLTEIEKSYPDVGLSDPYTFFTEYLDEVAYLAQQSASGVAILPYRTAAPAPFDCHIILGASQNNLQTVFSPLAFLSGSRRKKLGISDNDASLAFIKLHRFNSRLPAAFFCSEQTFSGYAIPHNALNAALKPMQRFGETLDHKAKFADDLYLAENRFYSSLHFHATHSGGEGVASRAKLVHANQERGFNAWKRRRESAPMGDDAGLDDGHPLSVLIRERFCRDGKRLSVSPSALGPYFQCPLKWVFARVLRLEALEIEAGLMADNITGLVYHAILNLFLDDLIKTGEAISPPVNSGSDKKPKPELPSHYRRLLAEKIEAVFVRFPCLPNGDRTEMSMLTARLLRAGKGLFYVRLEKFLAEFISFFAGYRVVASEPRYSIENDSYILNGTVDCILEDARQDSQAGGSLVIVDFKATLIPKLADCFGADGLGDFQIPAYLRLAEHALKKDVHTTLFFSIGDVKTQVWFGVIRNVLNDVSAPKKAEDRIIRGGDVFASIMSEFDDKTERFAKEVGGGTFSFSPHGSGRCLGCKYGKMCRVLYKIR